MEILGFIILALILAWVFFVATSSMVVKETQRNCVKNPQKKCPRIVEWQDGGFRVYNQLKCCKVIDQYKAANIIGCKAIPGKNYNGTIFTKEYVEQCKKSEEFMNKLDSSGPLD